MFPYYPSTPKVVLFSISGCQACADAKAYLRKNGIAFEVRDGSGMGEVPIIEANGRRLVGFSKRALDALFT